MLGRSFARPRRFSRMISRGSSVAARAAAPRPPVRCPGRFARWPRCRDQPRGDARAHPGHRQVGALVPGRDFGLQRLPMGGDLGLAAVQRSMKAFRSTRSGFQAGRGAPRSGRRGASGRYRRTSPPGPPPVPRTARPIRRLVTNRVPIQAPCAPSRSAAARPRPSAMPPAATTGIGATASTMAGSSANVPMAPACPPASPPWAMMTSAPAWAALIACASVCTCANTLAPAAWVAQRRVSGP